MTAERMYNHSRVGLTWLKDDLAMVNIFYPFDPALLAQTLEEIDSVSSAKKGVPYDLILDFKSVFSDVGNCDFNVDDLYRVLGDWFLADVDRGLRDCYLIIPPAAYNTFEFSAWLPPEFPVPLRFFTCDAVWEYFKLDPRTSIPLLQKQAGRPDAAAGMASNGLYIGVAWGAGFISELLSYNANDRFRSSLVDKSRFKGLRRVEFHDFRNLLVFTDPPGRGVTESAFDARAQALQDAELVVVLARHHATNLLREALKPLVLSSQLNLKITGNWEEAAAMLGMDVLELDQAYEEVRDQIRGFDKTPHVVGETDLGPFPNGYSDYFIKNRRRTVMIRRVGPVWRFPQETFRRSQWLWAQESIPQGLLLDFRGSMLRAHPDQDASATIAAFEHLVDVHQREIKQAPFEAGQLVVALCDINDFWIAETIVSLLVQHSVLEGRVVSSVPAAAALLEMNEARLEYYLSMLPTPPSLSDSQGPV